MNWKPLDWVDPRYEVSDTGLVRSWADSHGGVAATPRIRSQVVSKAGYAYVGLVIGGVHHNKTVHRLVLRAFTGTDGSVVNHINGVKHDNRLENLEWSTTSENAKHSFRVLGRAKPSGTLGKTLLSVRKHVLQSTTDGMWVRVWRGIQEAGDAGYSTTAISNVLHGRVRSHAGFNWSFFGE